METSIYDYLDLLRPNERKALEQKLIRYSDSTSTQIVITIIGSTRGENIMYLAPNGAKHGHWPKRKGQRDIDFTR